MRASSYGALLLGSWLGFMLPLPSAAAADAALFAGLAKPGQIRVDGSLGEWKGLAATRIGDDPSGRVDLRLAYDESGLYVGALVQDDELVRTRDPGTQEDALVVALAFAEAGRFVQSEVWLYAGVSGHSAAVMKLRQPGRASLRTLREPARIVEAPSEDGYVIEGFIPWSALEHGAQWPFVRAAATLRDVDRKGGPVRETSSSRAASAEALPWLLLDGGPVVAIGNFLRHKSLTGATAKLDWVGDVQGEGSAERVLVIGTYALLATSAGRFAYADLPVTTSAGVRDARMQDLNGDGKPELVLRLAQTNALGTRELMHVYDLRGERPSLVFALETRKELASGQIEASVETRTARGSRATEIVVRPGRAFGVSESSYQESPASDAEPILLPWGSVLERVYAWDGARFALSRQTGAQATRQEAAETAPRAPAAAREPTVPVSASVEALFSAYRSSRKVAANTPARFVTEANVLGDARRETLAVIGGDLVVVGEGFPSGPGYLYLGLPVREGSDVLRVFTGDVTGDGRREIFVRVRQRIGDVQRELLHAYTLGDGSPRSVLAVEVRRARGDDSIGNLVALVRNGRHFALQISPGIARGWTVDTYPFVAESVDGIGALLLPFRDGRVRYRYDGANLVASPD